MRRANSTISQRTAGLDIAQLHTYYSSVLTRGDNNIFTPVSRSEFSDLLGMLETVGLVSSSSAGSAASSPSKTGCRALGRAASFGVVKGAVTGQDIKLTETIRADRGLGVTDGSSDGDIREEEVRAIWARECGRIARESKTKLVAGASVDKPFEEAFED
jgi:cell division control protein 6